MLKILIRSMFRHPAHHPRLSSSCCATTSSVACRRPSCDLRWCVLLRTSRYLVTWATGLGRSARQVRMWLRCTCGVAMLGMQGMGLGIQAQLGALPPSTALQLAFISYCSVGHTLVHAA
jgi:hypothetical protein